MIFITYANVDFNCPHCHKQYSDKDEKYLNRCNKNKSTITKIKCDCGKKFNLTYDYMGQFQTFK